eukprot:scaffold12889_cov58-Phaeocystis_antarctica.AAC.6
MPPLDDGGFPLVKPNYSARWQSTHSYESPTICSYVITPLSSSSRAVAVHDRGGRCLSSLSLFSVGQHRRNILLADPLHLGVVVRSTRTNSLQGRKQWAARFFSTHGTSRAHRSRSSRAPNHQVRFTAVISK